MKDFHRRVVEKDVPGRILDFYGSLVNIIVKLIHNTAASSFSYLCLVNFPMRVVSQRRVIRSPFQLLEAVKDG